MKRVKRAGSVSDTLFAGRLGAPGTVTPPKGGVKHGVPGKALLGAGVVLRHTLDLGGGL